MTSDDPKKEFSSEARIAEFRHCGIVMPISAIDNCTEHHWSEVKDILSDSIEAVGLTSSLVSDSDEVGIIQKRIIQNLYENPIVVCDVSAKNPNVMFELGIRLAFDKPTIIVKDDRTTYSFDTAPIEHLEYPRDLRFAKIVEFKKVLGEKIRATLAQSDSNKDYTTFLKHFGKFTVAKLETNEVSKEDFIIEELREMKKMIFRQDSPYVSVAKESLLRETDARYAKIRRLAIEELSSMPKDENTSVNISMVVARIMGKITHEIEIRSKSEMNEVESMIRSAVRERIYTYYDFRKDE